MLNSNFGDPNVQRRRLAHARVDLALEEFHERVPSLLGSVEQLKRLGDARLGSAVEQPLVDLRG